jgi:hypothetical protein
MSLLAGVIGTPVAFWLSSVNQESIPLDPVPIAPLTAQQGWQAAQPHLDSADQDTAQAVERRIAEVDAYFRAVQSDERLQRFADEVLSMSAKWKYLTEGEAAFDAYVSQQFNDIVLSETNVNALVSDVVMAYGRELDAVDNNLLVALRSDTDIQSSNAVESLPTSAEIEQKFAEALQAARISAVADIPAEIARQVVVLIGTEIVTQVSTQALTSAGILTVGTASGAATFGIGLVASIIIDAAIQDAMNPQGQLVADLRGKLAEVRNATIDVARPYLEELGHQRSAVRRQLVAQTFGVNP